ncbi:hypothetical protein FJT64_013125 [Amphibalanus amphitrite]|uniref:Uncharacterized protein n=1 Tax=Amphibalanus amphitrite TaxID=1232801 RepID=A0A6A4VG80_AMPAM|nr:hypothetical protein FJT64_013125 [Amphibalanus amphitrite]
MGETNLRCRRDDHVKPGCCHGDLKPRRCHGDLLHWGDTSIDCRQLITVDLYNIPVFAEVDQLAQSLVSLVDVDGLVLNSMQVERLHQLWRRLHTHDRGRTVSTSIRSACVTRMHNYWRVGRRLGAMAGN